MALQNIPTAKIELPLDTIEIYQKAVELIYQQSHAKLDVRELTNMVLCMFTAEEIAEQFLGGITDISNEENLT